MPKSGTLVLSTVVIAIALLAPLFIAYAADSMRTYTQDVVVAETADNTILVYIYAKNSTGYSNYESEDFVITDDKYVLVPGITAGSLGDIAEITEFKLAMNVSQINGKWMWEQSITKVVVSFEGSKAISKSLTLRIAVRDSDGWHYLDVAEYSPNASAFTFTWSPTTIQLAQLSKYDDTVEAFQFALRSTDGSDLGYREDDYFAIRITFYTAQNPFSQEQIDILLLTSGIFMLICAAFATPYLSLKQLQALYTRKRR